MLSVHLQAGCKRREGLPILRRLRRVSAVLFLLIAAVCTCGAASAESSRDTLHSTVTVSIDRPLGRISALIYGQYLEHVERADECIYPSIWDAQSPFADADGLRIDVVDAVRELNVPIVRWPGGCFADVYHWEDGIGPRASRREKPNLHWGGIEPNHFGTDEFLRWCRLAGLEPYINVNLGSGTVDEALRWLEYCNGAVDTPQGARRASNGSIDPYGVKYWGIGNETWGPWEKGHTDAETYSGQLALWAREMRARDPNIRILGVGSEEGNDPEWDRAVLRNAGDVIDYLTLHVYGIAAFGRNADDFEAVAFTPVYLETRMRKMLRTIDESTTHPRSEPIHVSIDEWNIRHYDGKKLVRRDPRTLKDAVFVAGMLNSMIRLSPRIVMGNYVFLVNGNSTLLVDKNNIVQTPIAYVFQHYAKWMKGQATPAHVDGPTRMPPTPQIAHPGRAPDKDYSPTEAPYLDAAAALTDDATISIALVNRHPGQAINATLLLPNGYSISETWTLTHDDIHAANDFENGRRVTPVTVKVTSPAPAWKCPPHSVILLRCAR